MPAAPRRSPRSGRTRLPDTFVESLSGRGHRASSGGALRAPGTVTLGSATRSRDVAADSATIRRWRMSSRRRMPRARRSPIARMRAAWGMGSSSGWGMPRVGGAHLHPSISAAETKVLRFLGGGRQNLRWQPMNGQWRRSDGYTSSRPTHHPRLPPSAASATSPAASTTPGSSGGPAAERPHRADASSSGRPREHRLKLSQNLYAINMRARVSDGSR